MDKIKKEFETHFKKWSIVLPIKHLKSRSPGSISKHGWNIRYIFGKEAKREYLEFYAMHRMTDDRHLKIYEDGKCKSLNAQLYFFGYDANTPGDEKRAETAYRKHNQRVISELRKKGLA